MVSTIWFIGLLAYLCFHVICKSDGRYAPTFAWLALLIAGGTWTVLGGILLFTEPWIPAEYIDDTSSGGRNGWIANVIVFFHRLGPTWNAVIWGGFGLFSLYALWSGLWWRWPQSDREEGED